MPKYRLSEGRLVNVDTGEPLNDNNDYTPSIPSVRSDIAAYRSPINGALIDGKREQREDLKRNDCILSPPPERPRPFLNERFARKYGLPFEG